MDKITVSENRKRNVAALSVMTFCYAAFQGMCQSIVPLSMAHQAYTKTTIGLIQAVPGIIVILFGAPLARMANGRWRRETLSTCLGLAIVASLLYSIASRPMAFVVPQLLYGLSSSAFWSNMIATSFRIAEGSQQARKIQAYVTTFQGVGAFGGPMLGGYLSTFSYMYGFSAGVLIAVIGLVSSRFLSRSVAIEPRVSVREFITGAYVQLYRLVTREPIVLLGMSFVALNCFLLYVMGGSFYLLYASQIGLSAFVAASLVSGRDAISAVVRFGFDTITRYASPIILLGVGTLLGALSLALLPMTVSLLGVSIVAVAQGVFLALLPPAVNTLVGSATEPKHHSFAIVGMHSSNFIAQTTMSPLLGLLLSGFGYNIVYPVIGGIWIVLALLVFGVGLRMIRQGKTRELVVSSSTAD